MTLDEQEKINYFWIVEKKTLEDKKADLRNKERELQVGEISVPSPAFCGGVHRLRSFPLSGPKVS